jgi:hypothetical protein
MKRTVSSLAVVVLISVGNLCADSTATRSLNSTTYTPGQPIVVTLVLSPDSTILAYGLEETPPSSWSLSNISADGTIAGGMIKWGVYRDNQPRTLSYTATPGASESGSKDFSGRVSYDGVSQTIAGTTSVNSSGAGTPSVATDTAFLPFKNILNLSKDSTMTVSFTVAGEPMTSSGTRSSSLYGSSGSSDVSITVYDRQGQVVRKLERNGGTAAWDGRNSGGETVASGTYLLVLKQGNKVQKKKVVVIK